MRKLSLPAAFTALLLTAAASQAVKPEAWTAASKKDFEAGTFAGTVVDSYGQLTLGREMTPIKVGESAEIVTAFTQTPDGAIYAAVNPDGKIYRITGTETKVVYSAPKGFTDITAMAVDTNGNLLVALVGKTARVVKLPIIKMSDPLKTRPVFENENVENIWAIAVAPDGTTYIGTGPNGKVYRLTDDPAGASVLEAPATNVTALAFDQNQNLIAGTDAKGLIIRFDLKTKKPFVLLDAGKVDVNAIVTDKAGNIYVATAKTDPDEPPDTDAEPNTKSKPGEPEPEPMDPPGVDAPDKKGARAPIHLNPEILAANDPGIPPDLKKLLDKAAAANDKGKDNPTTKKKVGLPSKEKESGPNHHAASPEPEESPADSSAVYRITPEGAVTTLLQESDANYSLLLSGDDLLVGTGNEGKLFRYHLPDESLTLLARLKEEHITALFAAKDGDLYAGTANMGTVYRIGATLAKSGTFTSPVLDATNTAVWGKATLDLLPALPPGTKATIATRSGNTRSVENGSDKFWSDWSPEIDGVDGTKISSPEARYLQFRVTLTSDAKAQTAPVVSKLRVAYQTQNLPPKISAVTVLLGKQSTDGDDSGDPADLTSDADSPPNIAKIAWDASDPNGDTLVYRVFYRSAALVDGKEDAWTPLTKEIKDSTYDWDIRTLADGKYQVKVTASDKPDNTVADAKEVARTSAPIIIDHTPPVLGDLKATTDGNKATLSGDATDAMSAISDVRYQIDGQGDWQPAAASDKMFDSPHEGFTIVTAPLSAGAHRITVRATDAAGNCSYKTATVTVKQ